MTTAATLFTGDHWFGVTKFDHIAVDLYSRHYSSRKNGKAVRDWLESGITPPGESMTLLTPDGSALFVWVKQNRRDDGEIGVNCSVFRNEAPEQYLSSALILEAEGLAWDRWPGERLFTFVDGRAVHGDGCCFKRAGWRKLSRRTKGGLIILEKQPLMYEAVVRSMISGDHPEPRRGSHEKRPDGF